MKKLSKVFGVAVLCVAIMLSFPACSPGAKTVVYGKGDVFNVKSIDDFVLDKIVLLPEYNTASKTGYGVVFLKKEASAPISFTMGSSANQASSPKSLVDLTLMDGENAMRSSNISFAQVDNSPVYKGSATFAFQIEDGQPFPAKGSFSYAAAGSADKQEFEIDLSSLTVPEANKESVSDNSSTAQPEQQPKENADEATLPSTQSTIAPESAGAPAIASDMAASPSPLSPVDEEDSVLDLDPETADDITRQSTRYSVDGTEITVSGAAPITLAGDGTNGGWNLVISDAIEIVIEDGTTINAASGNALTVPNGATIKGGGDDITINAVGDGGSGVLSEGSVTISGVIGSITAYDFGIQSQYGSVTISGTVGDIVALLYSGIYAQEDIVISGETGNIYAGYAALANGNGIFTYGNITISGTVGDITAVSPEGIFAFNGDVYITGTGKVGKINVHSTSDANYSAGGNGINSLEGSVTIDGTVGK